MRFDTLLISFLMVALVSFCCITMIGDMNSKYAFAGVNVSNDSFTGVYVKTSEISEIVEQANNQTLKGEIEGGTSTIDSMILGSYTALRLIGSTFGLFSDIVWAVSDTLHIPQPIVVIVIAMFIITVLFTLIYMIFRMAMN